MFGRISGGSYGFPSRDCVRGLGKAAWAVRRRQPSKPRRSRSNRHAVKRGMRRALRVPLLACQVAGICHRERDQAGCRRKCAWSRPAAKASPQEEGAPRRTFNALSPIFYVARSRLAGSSTAPLPVARPAPKASQLSGFAGHRLFCGSNRSAADASLPFLPYNPFIHWRRH